MYFCNHVKTTNTISQMRKKNFLLLLLVIGVQAFAQTGNNMRESKNNLKDMNLFGKVKTFKITPYKLVDYFGKITKGDKQEFWRGDVVIVFDEHGYKAENNTYNKVGNLSQKVIYKYDDKGKRLSRDLYNAYGKLQMKFLYVYDNKGAKTAYNSYSPTGELNDSYLYKNDDKGRMIEEVWIKKDKSFGSKYTYEYDKMGKLAKMCQYTASETQVDNCTSYKYDKNGRISEIEIYNSNNSLSRRSVITYDEKGNEKEIKYYDGKGTFLEERSYTYKFDNNGNWIERIESINQFPKSFLEREITYYP